MAQAFEYCEQLVRQNDKDRFLAALFAPADRRGALHALYAFDLEIAGIGARVHEPMAGELRLQWWREVLAGARAEEARASPLAAALCQTAAREHVSRELLIGFIDAHAFDLYREPMATVADFESYARRTTGAIMQLAALALDSTENAGLEAVAGHAGIATALSDALRHIARSASRRQLLLPAEVLARHGVEPDDVYSGRAAAGLLPALKDLRGLARHHLEMALRLVPAVPPAARAALLPLALVPLYLARMERSDYEPFATPIEVPQWRRQLRLWRTARAWLR